MGRIVDTAARGVAVANMLLCHFAFLRDLSS
jgi:hypothetical protein